MTPALMRQLLAAAFLAVVTLAHAQMTAPASSLPAIPPGKETDLKLYAANGTVVTGRDALERMAQASVVLWLAGNQFFAMDDVIGAFAKQHPGRASA